MNFGDTVYVLNGSYGTYCESRGWLKEMHLAELNIKNPEAVAELYKSYKDAGCDIITTNTFQGNRLRLRELGLVGHFEEINKEAVRLAKESGCIVAGGIGPTGKYLEPLGELSFDQAYNTFAEQVALLDGVDLVLIETFTDIKEAKAAVIAAKETLDVPVVCTLAFEEGGRTAAGTDVRTAISVLSAAGASVVGANCGVSLEEMEKIAEIFAKESPLPFSIKPNAGMPKIVDGKSVFEETPERMAVYAKKFIGTGAVIIGGCCGTTPEHLRAIAGAVKGARPVQREVGRKTLLSSRACTVEIEKELVIIGERINPTGKRGLATELSEEKIGVVRKEANNQAEEGAQMIDVNVSAPGVDGIVMLPAAVGAVQGTVNAPISIDTTDVEALEAALKMSDGKPLINSTTGEQERMEQVFGLAKRYGAAVIGLAMDERGLPKTAEDRVEIAKRIVEVGSKYIPKEDILIDCLARTVAAEQGQALETLKALKEVKKLGVKTVLGVSNVSHGLPNRPLLNATFLEMALEAGLDAVIYNPMQLGIKPSEAARKVIVGEDKNAVEYIRENTGHVEEESSGELTIEEELRNAVLHGYEENIAGLVEQALGSKKPIEVNATLVSAMEEVGRKFKNGKYFLPQVMLSASAMKKAFARLKEEIKTEEGKARGKIIFATVKGDVHDIGKNIVIALLEANNFEVIDLGADVPPEIIVEVAAEHTPGLIGLSALMTTTMTGIPGVIAGLKKNGVNIPVMIGGAVVTEEYAREVGAHYAGDAIAAVELVKTLLK